MPRSRPRPRPNPRKRRVAISSSGIGYTALPELYTACSYCCDPAVLKKNHADWREWNQKEDDAEKAHIAAGGTYHTWREQPAYRELLYSQPEDINDGCGNCDGLKVEPTAAGAQILDFLHAMNWKSA